MNTVTSRHRVPVLGVYVVLAVGAAVFMCLDVMYWALRIGTTSVRGTVGRTPARHA
jgi:hypothetical protein